MKRVNDYKFAWPCYLCGFKLPIRQHRRHFIENHPEIDITRVCYMCLCQFNPPIREHHSLCVNQIFKTRKLRSAKLVLQGTLVQVIRNSTSSQNIVQPHLNSSVIDYLTPFQNREAPAARRIQLKLRYIENNNVKPLFMEEQHQLIRYVLENESSVFNWEVKQFIACLSEQKWYHLIVSVYHIAQFAELAAPLIEVAPFKCMCSGSSSSSNTTTTTDDRVVHAHLLARITNIKKFKLQCWSKLSSPNGCRFKMIIAMKSRYHLYNTIYYLCRPIKCGSMESKHYEIRVPLLKTHANLALLMFRDMLYDNKLEPIKNQMSLATFDIWSCKNQRSDEYFVSHAGHVVSKMKTLNQIVVAGHRLVQSNIPSGVTLTTRKNNTGYLDIERWPGNNITIANVLEEADGLDYWIVWRSDKALHITEMVTAQLQKHHHLAVHVDEERNLAFFGDYWRGSFKQQEKESALLALTKACVYASAVIVKDNQQLHLVKQLIPEDMTIRHATQKNTIAKHQDILDTAFNLAMMMYYSEIDHRNVLLQPN